MTDKEINEAVARKKSGYPAKPIKDRILARRSIIGECWIWQGRKNNHGYGKIMVGHTKSRYVHRVSYEEFVGPLNGLCVLHSCDTPSCFNPKHLRLGTQAENLKDMRDKGRAFDQKVRRSLAFLALDARGDER